jgi:hypothetical protein
MEGQLEDGRRISVLTSEIKVILYITIFNRKRYKRKVVLQNISEKHNSLLFKGYKYLDCSFIVSITII